MNLLSCAFNLVSNVRILSIELLEKKKLREKTVPDQDNKETETDLEWKPKRNSQHSKRERWDEISFVNYKTGMRT